MGVMRHFGPLVFVTSLAACGMPEWVTGPETPEEIDDVAEVATVPEAPPPPASARTAEQFDTTTAQDRAEVVEAAAEPASDVALGTTIASLGNPAEPGFWLKTPLVSEEGPGRVEYAEAGTSVAVTLIPIEGPETGGSRLSLPAMRLLQAPLSSLPEILVFAR